MRALKLVPDGPDALRAEVLWTADLTAGQRVYATPLIFQGKLWVMQEGDTVRVFDAQSGALTGSVNVSGSRPGGYYASPVATDAAVWFGQEGGLLQEVRLSGAGALTATPHVVEGTRSVPLFVGDRVYVRTFGALWAFE